MPGEPADGADGGDGKRPPAMVKWPGIVLDQVERMEPSGARLPWKAPRHVRASSLIEGEE